MEGWIAALRLVSRSGVLRALGVQGADADLDKVVAQWDGHALTLSLLGTLLAEPPGMGGGNGGIPRSAIRP